MKEVDKVAPLLKEAWTISQFSEIKNNQKARLRYLLSEIDRILGAE